MSDSSFFKNIGSTASFDVVAVSQSLLAQVELAKDAATTATTTLEQINGIVTTVNQTAAVVSQNASEAAGSATAASTAQVTAQTSSNESQARAEAASQSAAAAASSAASASASKLAAGDFVSSLLATHTEFSTLYLGAYETAPTAQTNGDSLEDGNQYLDTSTTPHSMKIYDAANTEWRPLISPTAHRTRTLFVYTVDDATLLSHEFSGPDDNNKTLGFTQGNFNVFINGVMLIPTLDYSTTGTTTLNIALNITLTTGDHVMIEVFSNFELDDHVAANTGGDFHGSVDFHGDTTFQGNIAFQGNSTIQGNVSSQGDIVSQGSFTGSGTNTFTTEVTMNANLDVTGDATVDGDFTCASVTNARDIVATRSFGLGDASSQLLVANTLTGEVTVNGLFDVYGTFKVAQSSTGTPAIHSAGEVVGIGRINETADAMLSVGPRGTNSFAKLVIAGTSGGLGRLVLGSSNSVQVSGEGGHMKLGLETGILAQGDVHIDEHGMYVASAAGALTSGSLLTKTGATLKSPQTTPLTVVRDADASTTEREIVRFDTSAGQVGSVAAADGGVLYRTSDGSSGLSLGPEGLKTGNAFYYAVPVGTILDYAGTTAPDGFVFCNGQALSRTQYDGLFAIIGTTYGDGGPGADQNTHFRVPDLRGMVTAGLQAPEAGVTPTVPTNILGSNLGATGGAAEVTLTENEMPSHSHTGTTNTEPDHTHGAGSYESVDNEYNTNEGTIDGNRYRLVYGGAQTETVRLPVAGTSAPAGTHTHTVTTNDVGGGNAFSNLQPTMALNKIIRV